MTHEWTVTRRDPVEDAMLGVFESGNGATCYSLERYAVSIPEGRYRVTLTVSDRATHGSLWSPDTLFRLPLINDVPGREGIRIHAANQASELLGCIAVGAEIDGERLIQSRPSVTRIVQELISADQAGDEVWLTVRNGGITSTPMWAR